jgi:hypothetical protein
MRVIFRFVHVTAKHSAAQDLSRSLAVREAVLDSGNVLCLDQTRDDMKAIALVWDIADKRFSELYWKWRPAYDYGNIDGPARDFRSIKPELAINRNCLGLLKAAPQDILYQDNRAENIEAATCSGISAVMFDTAEKTASRVESLFDIHVPSHGRCLQSNSQHSPTSLRSNRTEPD